MAALCKIYSAEVVARQAVDALTAAGVPGRDIRVLTGSRVHDVRREVAGSFYGRVYPGEPVGTFAGPPKARGDGAGTFAGDARRQRQGSFADTSGDPTARRLLQRFSVSGKRVDDVLRALHAGRAVVVAEVSEIPPSEAATRLDELAPVA